MKKTCLRCRRKTANFPGRRACCGTCLSELAAMHRHAEGKREKSE